MQSRDQRPYQQRFPESRVTKYRRHTTLVVCIVFQGFQKPVAGGGKVEKPRVDTILERKAPKSEKVAVHSSFTSRVGFIGIVKWRGQRMVERATVTPTSQ